MFSSYSQIINSLKFIPPSFNIPKIIHFVWAGGSKQMPKQSVEVVKRWAHSNAQSQVVIWVDLETFPGNSKKALMQYYKDIFNELHKNELNEKPINIIFEESDILTSGNASHVNPDTINVVLKDIKIFRDEIVAYEIEKLNPNYGASSDYLRYQILYKYGGMYIDSDVCPGEDCLEKSNVFESMQKHVLYLEHKPQRTIGRQQIKLEDLRKFTVDELGNDTFLSTPNNPILKKIIESLKERYHIKYNQKNFYLMLECAHGSLITKNEDTIKKTGPELIRDVIGSCPEKDFTLHNNDLIKYIDEVPIIIKRIRNGDYSLAEPDRNTRFWLQVPITCCDWQIALESIRKTIKFDLEHFNVLRLDDYIESLIEAQKETLKPHQAAKLILDEVKILLQGCSDKCLFCQLTFKYPETIEFLKKHEKITHLLKLAESEGNEEFVEFILDRELSLNYVIQMTNNIASVFENINSLHQEQAIAQAKKKVQSYLKETLSHPNNAIFLKAAVKEAEYVLTFIENSLDCLCNTPINSLFLEKAIAALGESLGLFTIVAKIFPKYENLRGNLFSKVEQLQQQSQNIKNIAQPVPFSL